MCEMSGLAEIQELWKRHLATTFPPECRGMEVEGIELVLLDADIAGCITAYLGQRVVHNWHDLKRKKTLRRCCADLARVDLKLEGRARAYFERLLLLTRKVLVNVDPGCLEREPSTEVDT